MHQPTVETLCLADRGKRIKDGGPDHKAFTVYRARQGDWVFGECSGRVCLMELGEQVSERPEEEVIAQSWKGDLEPTRP